MLFRSYPFGFSENAESYVAFFSLFFSFFFAFTHSMEETKFTVHETNVTVHAQFWYYSHTVHRTHSHFIQKKIYILKMDSTILLTHLKIIFSTVFSIFNFSNNKFNPNGSSNNVICIF